MNARMLTRNIIIGSRRTTVRLEAAIWEALDEICVRERTTRHDLCTQIESGRDGINRAQAVRSVVINYFRLSLKKGAAGSGVLQTALTFENDIGA